MQVSALSSHMDNFRRRQSPLSNSSMLRPRRGIGWRFASANQSPNAWSDYGKFSGVSLLGCGRCLCDWRSTANAGWARPCPTEELVELDTGYTGEVLAPWRLYVALELYGWEVAEELWSEGISVTGETFAMPLSEAILRVPQLNAAFPVEVDTFEGNEQFLIGRAFLRKHRLLLDGPASRVCMIPSTATTIELP